MEPVNEPQFVPNPSPVPVTMETPEQKQARENADRVAREMNELRLRDMSGNGNTNTTQPGKVEISPITAAMMRGDRVTVKIGTLELSLKPMTRKKVRQFNDLIMRQWPTLIWVAASVENPKCDGFDLVGVAKFYDDMERIEYDAKEIKRAKELAEAAQALSEDATDEEKAAVKYVRDAEPDLHTIDDILDIYQSIDAQLDRFMPVICDTAWLMAEGMPEIVWPKPMSEKDTGEKDDEGKPIMERVAPKLPKGKTYLSDLLEEHLRTPQYADLLRALWAANGGFAGDLASRFQATIDAKTK